ncbi:hypothetical protein JOC34_002815 [Virgibacillus halotolerans]|uniref:tail assembly chaperone n=1 Tax=Virgibacillus halotolerans TaxID=1071053 RepID=UPI0019616CB2|nr:tail assembly chaperone [Virgibacillus halotolerans]MBM7600424.1 hypothetical protein [Virgibacillus halotolerans]
MATFEIDGKEYDLKLTFPSVKYLNGQLQGGQMEVIGKALMADLEFFPHVVHAGLFHTDEKFTYKKVEKAIEKAFDDEKLDASDMMRISNEVVTDSFFYRKLTEKLLAESPEAAEALKKLAN